MFRTTQDVVELRRWAEARGVRPSRDADTGRLLLSRSGEGSAGLEVGWEEFEPAFLTRGDVFVYDEAPRSSRCFVGAAEEARAFVRGLAGGAEAPAASLPSSLPPR